MDAYCENCNGITYHVEDTIDDRQGNERTFIECEECGKLVFIN